MAAVLLEPIPRVHGKIFRKDSVFSANTFEKFIVSKESCIAHDDNKTCFLAQCKYRILLVDDS